MSTPHTLSGRRDSWEAVVDDMAATAAEYREDGFETLELHPGDVTALPTDSLLAGDGDIDRAGLDLLLPGNEFSDLQAVVADHEFEAYDAYRASEGTVVFAVVAMRSVDDEAAVLFPLYYDTTDAKVTLAHAAERGELRTFLRPLDDSERVVFSQSEPDTLLPETFDPAAVDVPAALDALDD